MGMGTFILLLAKPMMYAICAMVLAFLLRTLRAEMYKNSLPEWVFNPPTIPDYSYVKPTAPAVKVTKIVMPRVEETNYFAAKIVIESMLFALSTVVYGGHKRGGKTEQEIIDRAADMWTTGYIYGLTSWFVSRKVSDESANTKKLSQKITQDILENIKVFVEADQGERAHRVERYTFGDINGFRWMIEKIESGAVGSEDAEVKEVYAEFQAGFEKAMENAIVCLEHYFPLVEDDWSSKTIDAEALKVKKHHKSSGSIGQYLSFGNK